jgi:hypothetical protein
MPNIPAKRLKALVSDGRVPQWPTGGTKGVWFTGRPQAEPTV